MLHSLSVNSAKEVLKIFQQQTLKTIEITDLVEPIPDTIEELEQMLQV